MSLVILVACVIITISRAIRGAPYVVPAVVGGISLIEVVFTAASLRDAYRAVGCASPADRSTILAAAIGEGLNEAAFWLLFNTALLVVAVVVDRFTRKAPS